MTEESSRSRLQKILRFAQNDKEVGAHREVTAGHIGPALPDKEKRSDVILRECNDRRIYSEPVTEDSSLRSE